jgi:hypothetical protein
MRLSCSLDVFAGFLCEIFGFPKFLFRLEPELFIPSGWFAIFFPDFSGALSDSPLVGPRQGAGSVFQFFRQCQYALSCFPVANPPREVAVLIGFHEKAGDNLLSIHCALHLGIIRWSRENVQGRRANLAFAPVALPYLNVVAPSELLGGLHLRIVIGAVGFDRPENMAVETNEINPMLGHLHPLFPRQAPPRRSQTTRLVCSAPGLKTKNPSDCFSLTRPITRRKCCRESSAMPPAMAPTQRLTAGPCGCPPPAPVTVDVGAASRAVLCLRSDRRRKRNSDGNLLAVPTFSWQRIQNDGRISWNRGCAAPG